MKKHKKILICLTIMLAFIAAIVTGYVSNAASNYNPSESQFLNDKAINLLGRNLNSGGTFWKNLFSKGMLSCFYHKASQPTQGMNTKIHSVFDIQFDEEKGAMKVTSIINDGNRTPKVTYVTDQNGKVVANLVAQASKKGNARMVYEALRKAINAGVVVNEPAINHQQYWWPNGTKNPAGNNEIGNYTGYRKVTKDETVVAKSIKEVTINNKSYTVLGRFKMTFAGKGISSVQVGNAKWTPNSKSNEIYVYSKLIGEKWTTDFNKLKSANSYALNGRSFYLAVETSKLPSNGSFDVTITQDKFQYTNARIVVCVGTKQQQTGLYCYDNSPSTFEGQVKWTIKQENVPTTMEIIKTDETTGKELTDAKFKVYAELTDGTKGWLSGEADGTKTYGVTAKEYDSNKDINNLREGTYYIYETKAPTGYNLADQKGYHKEAKGSSSLTGDWVYLGTATINKNSSSKVTFKAENTPPTTPPPTPTPEEKVSGLQIIKVDEKSGKELDGAKFKIYGVATDGTKGWVLGDVNGTKKYGDTAAEYTAKTTIKNLKYGKYYIYETKAPDGYDITSQDGYHKKAEGSDKLTGDWVYLGMAELSKDWSNNNPFKVRLTNHLPGNMTIIKTDKDTNAELTGAKFKIYAVLSDGTKGWVSGKAAETKTYGKEMTEYEAKEIIKNLKYGTYYIYETKTPEGYNIKKQQGYHKEAAGSSELSGDWVYLGSQVINVNSPANDIFTFSAPNKKVVEIEGKVWQDVDNSKGNTLDYVYKKETGDILKQGITVNLYNGQNQLIATEKTSNDGTYKFTTKNAPSYTGTDKDLTYSDLTNSYVEFIYNNKTTYDNEGKAKEYGYIAVDPFVGTDASINSKAQEETITTVKLDDNNLTGTTGNNPGRAVTKRNLTEYFENATYKVSNINLGLMEQHDAQFNVGEELAYIKVKMKGYTYTYKYGDASKTTSTNVPTVNEQNSTRTYTGKIYPTDIAYNMAESTEELKVYAIYKINVQNTDTVNIDNQYVEERLYLDSLESTFDTDRYELCTDQNNEDKSDFALWSNAGDGKAKYDVNNNNSQFKDGITKLETKTSYIQFKLKDAAVKRILTNSTEPNIEKAPTVATAKGYHEYLRTDNAWNHNNNVVAYEGSKGASNYPKKNNSGKKYYVHKTISKTSSSSALYLRLSLGEARQISGTVFEDTRTDESKKANTNLGNGIIDSSENNRANNVTVELLNADKTTVTKLYKEKDGKVVYEEDGKLPEARTQTGADGSFRFEGVVPGYYYIRFTYGDGTQKMLPANSVIKSNDYKSTIVNTETNGAGDIIKNAMEISSTALENVQQTLLKDYTNEQAKKLVEWYKYLNTNSYSVAVDDQAQRLQTAGYEYREDGKVYDKDGKEITNYIKNINAYTPILGISIENDVNNSTDEGNVQSANYNAFNFGIIKEKDTIVTLDKKITNVNLTNQVGSTVVSANPADKTNPYLTALDKITGGSKQAKLEIESNMIYGSALKTTYEITIKNESSKDYIEDENSDKFGYYYKYGDITDTAKLKELTINKVKDELDKKYKYDTSMSTIKEIVVHENNVTNESNVKVEQESIADENGSSNALAITGWSKLESGAKASVTYDVTSLLSAEDDTAYGNEAKIASVSLDMLETLNSNFDWSKNDKTTISIVPSTGADRSNIYVIAGVVALVVISGGLFFLKKKVLK